MTLDRFYDLLVPLVLIAIAWAITQCLRVIRRNGARIYLNKFGLLILGFSAIIYTLNLFEVIPDKDMTFWLRPSNFAIYLFIGLLFKTERRSKW
jgi:hypothetical protein